MSRASNYLCGVSLIFGSFCLAAEESKPVTFDDQISPILKRHCWQCHGDAKQESGLNLASYDAAIKGSSGGPVVVSGRSSGSRLFKAITAEDPVERMPPQSDPLPKEMIAAIKTWIDTGLRQNSGSAAVPAKSLGFTPSALVEGGPAVMPENLPVVKYSKTTRPFAVLSMASSPRAPLVAVSAYERVDLINPETKAVIGSLPFAEGEPHVLRFNRSGSILLAAGGRPVQNGVAILFDVKTGKRLAELGNEADEVLAADLSPDERQIAIGGSGRIVKMISTADGTVRQTLIKHTDWITAIAFSPDGKLLASGDRVGNIHLWDASSGGVVLPLSEHKAAVRSLSWRSDSQVLASCGEDGQLIWWDVVKGWPAISKGDAHPPVRPPGTYGKIANGILDANFGPHGELVSCGRDQVVRVWSVDGTVSKTFSTKPETKGDSAPPTIRILPLRSVVTFDGSYAVAGDWAGNIFSWPIKTASKP